MKSRLKAGWPPVDSYLVWNHLVSERFRVANADRKIRPAVVFAVSPRSEPTLLQQRRQETAEDTPFADERIGKAAAADPKRPSDGPKDSERTR